MRSIRGDNKCHLKDMFKVDGVNDSPLELQVFLQALFQSEYV